MKIAVVGGSAFGTALAQAVASMTGWPVTIGVYEKVLVEAINECAENSLYLPGVRLSPRITAVHPEAAVFADDPDIVFWAVPSAHCVDVAERCVSSMTQSLYIMGTKGFVRFSDEDNHVGTLPAEALERYVPDGVNVLALAGPSYARSLAKEHPTVVTLGGDLFVARRLTEILRFPDGRSSLSIVGTTDRFGVELCAALRTIYAIGAGILHGAESDYGDNLLSFYFTAALGEMRRFVAIAGGNADTVLLPCGVGDLHLTLSLQSRNARFGSLLSADHTTQEALQVMGNTTVEGYHALLNVWPIIQRLCAEYEQPVRFPILAILTDIVHGVVSERPTAADIVQLLEKIARA